MPNEKPRVFTELVGVKLSKEQRQFVEEQRGSLTPSQYLRLLVVRERRRVGKDTPEE